jgi:hypothetical protein
MNEIIWADILEQIKNWLITRDEAYETMKKLK